MPHATAAYLADQMLASAGRPAHLRTMTTLHGTDVTLIGSDPSYSWVVAFSLERSHHVTAVSDSLKADTVAAVGVRREIEVIPNFLDCDVYRRVPEAHLRGRFAADDEAIVVHMSNFRPVKRVDAVIEVFRRIRDARRARLLLVGDGPVRPEVERLVHDRGLTDDVVFLGEQRDPVRWLSIADLFLLPSAQESFGLAALEAMACEVPVVASNVGGLPEIVRDGVTGYACPPDATADMAEKALALLRDDERRRAMGVEGARMVRTEYCVDRIVPMYERAYERVRAVGLR